MNLLLPIATEVIHMTVYNTREGAEWAEQLAKNSDSRK